MVLGCGLVTAGVTPGVTGFVPCCDLSARGCRIQYQQSTRDYIARRTTEGQTSREIKRCLARYVARDLYRLLESGPGAA